MKNPCNECNNFHYYKMSESNICLGFCSITGIIDNTKKCENVTSRASDYKEFIEEENDAIKMAELFWKFDSKLNILNPDYKEAENDI